MKKLLSLTFGMVLLGMAALFTLAIPHTAAANSTTLGVPGAAGRPQQDNINMSRIEARYNRSIGDFSLGLNYPNVLSSTTTAINVTDTTKLSPSSTVPYAGPVQVYVYNTGLTPLMAFVSMTPSAIAGTTCTQTAGLLVAAGASGVIDCQARDGITLHIRGVGITASANVGFGTY